MKSKFKRTLFSGLTGAMLLTTAASAVDTSNGDIYLGFYQVDGNDLVGPNTYFFNLGPASAIRENTQNNVLISAVVPAIANANIAADLEAAFGPGWADDGTVFWGIVGGLNQTTIGLVGGDTQGTSYVSRPVSTFVAAGATSPQPLVTGGPRNTLRNNIEAYQVAHDNIGTPGANSRGAIRASGGIDTFDTLLPPTSTGGAQFGIGQEIRQRFDAGVVPGSESLEGALDVWRLIGGTSTANVNASGADFTSGFGSGNAVLGQGQFCGTITLGSDGNIRVGGTATGGGGDFASWAIENGVTGGPGGDSDADGITNLVEYALLTDLTGSDGSPGTFNGSLLSFTKRGTAVTNGDVEYSIEESDDLGITDPWQPAAATNSPTSISYTLPSGAPRKFARLKLRTLP